MNLVLKEPGWGMERSFSLRGKNIRGGHMSLVLTGADIMQILGHGPGPGRGPEAFRAYGEGRVNMPPKSI